MRVIGPLAARKLGGSGIRKSHHGRCGPRHSAGLFFHPVAKQNHRARRLRTACTIALPACSGDGLIVAYMFPSARRAAICVRRPAQSRVVHALRTHVEMERSPAHRAPSQKSRTFHRQRDFFNGLNGVQNNANYKVKADSDAVLENCMAAFPMPIFSTSVAETIRWIA